VEYLNPKMPVKCALVWGITMGTDSEGKWAPIPTKMGGIEIAESAGRGFVPH
jgi:hypothetical protein